MSKHQGFTQIELVMVIIIMAIIGVVIFFSWPGKTINLGAQAKQLSNDIRYAQSLAMTKGQRYRWVKLSSSTYQIQDNSGTAIMLALGNTTMTLSSGITFGTLTNLPNNLVNFDGKGAPYTDTSSPGTALVSDANIPLTDGDSTKTVVVTAGTGRVAVQ